MYRAVVTVALLVVLVSSKFSTPDYDSAIHSKVFKKWKNEFSITFKSIEEEAHKFAVFLENWRYIDQHNNLGTSTYTLGLNQFAAMTPTEFRMHIHGHTGSCLQKGGEKLPKSTYDPSLAYVNLPTSIDWTTKGVVTPVKNQQQCGSCWAFSATGSIESRYAIKTGKLQPLSEQELVDCSGSYGNNGCGGGLMDNAFRYVKAKGGLCSESEYPYKAADGTCKSCSTRYDPISNYQDVQRQSESALMAAVAAGPVSIAIEADQQAFQFYNGGVLSKSCGTRLDHGVLVVGYGATGGQSFWKVKNSWGKTWGMNGYILLCRDCAKNGSQGECGILDQPSFPIAA